MINNKRGLSEVVTAVLLVLLAIAAVVIVWAVVRGFIQQSTGGASTGCASIQLSITVDSVGNTVDVKREPNLAGSVSLVNLRIFVQNATGASADSTFIAANTKTELGTDPNIVLPVAVVTDYNKVLVYPVISTETGDKLCNSPTTWTR